MKTLKNLLSAVSYLIPSACFALCLWAGTQWFEDRAEPQTGFGAYMLLEFTTPAILFGLAVSGALRLIMIERNQRLFLYLLISALLALGLNWWLVEFVLRP
jgi:hypothetical protein